MVQYSVLDILSLNEKSNEKRVLIIFKSIPCKSESLGTVCCKTEKRTEDTLMLKCSLKY